MLRLSSRYTYHLGLWGCKCSNLLGWEKANCHVVHDSHRCYCWCHSLLKELRFLAEKQVDQLAMQVHRSHPYLLTSLAPPHCRCSVKRHRHGVCIMIDSSIGAQVASAIVSRIDTARQASDDNKARRRTSTVIREGIKEQLEQLRSGPLLHLWANTYL